MPEPADEAAEQLRAIRSLMERSTVYRAISGPAAAFAGVLSLAVCAWLWQLREPSENPDPLVFMGIWLGVLLIASVVNTALLYRSARSRGKCSCPPG